MEVEQLEIRDYLAKIAPLTDLPKEALNEITMALQIQYARRGTEVLKIGQRNDVVYLIRSGAVEVLLENGDLYGRFTEGEWVGYRSVMRGGPVSLNVNAIEDTLFYAIPADSFLGLVKRYDKVRQYFAERKPDRLRSAIQDIRGADNHAMIAMHIRDLMKLPMLVSEEDSIRQVAQQMTQVNAQTAMVTNQEGLLSGIVTDVDFRKRVVAEGVDVALPVSNIMTAKPLTLAPDDQASEALLLMARRNIRHIPIVDNAEVVGVISATDLLRSQSHNAIYLVGDIYAAKDIERLKMLSATLPKVLVSLVNNNMPAYDIGHAISSIGQAIMRRLAAMGEEKFGQPPVPYCLVVAGSMARREQTAHSDQDNGMILSDDYDPALHGEYFANLAKFICDGLNECGYVYCPGNIMATNEQWRQPYKVWKDYFTNWILTPEPQALLYSTIFFDMRSLYGDDCLLYTLRQEVLDMTKSHALFQTLLASNALTFKPPLGFFRGFVLDKGGNNEKGMDMKKRGVVPVIDLVRVFALAEGVRKVNTWDRLQQLETIEGGVLSSSMIEDLRDAFELISMIRLRHQAAQIEKGQAPDNYVPPEDLSVLERRHLKDAFEVISNTQGIMSTHYKADRFR